MEIKRYYPTKINDKDNHYNYIIWGRFNELKEDDEFLRKFELFEKNIDYKTGEKIKPEDYDSLKNEFIVYRKGKMSMVDVYFDDVLNVVRDYNKKEYVKADGSITTVENYNKEIDKVNEKINELTHWDEYIEFNGKKYGIPAIFKNVHRENDCFGDITYEIGDYDCRLYSCNKCGQKLTDKLDIICINMYDNNDYYQDPYYSWIIP